MRFPNNSHDQCSAVQAVVVSQPSSRGRSSTPPSNNSDSNSQEIAETHGAASTVLNKSDSKDNEDSSKSSVTTEELTEKQNLPNRFPPVLQSVVNGVHSMLREF